jgi:hypothetical protein
MEVLGFVLKKNTNISTEAYNSRLENRAGSISELAVSLTVDVHHVDGYPGHQGVQIVRAQLLTPQPAEIRIIAGLELFGKIA